MAEPARAPPWLPDLCRLPRIALLLGVAELTVAVIALAPDGGARWSLGRFASASGFALWLALTVAVLLCVARAPLSRLGRPAGGAAAVLAAAMVAAAGAAMMHVIDANLGYGLVPEDVTLVRFVLGSAAVTALIVAVALRYLYAVEGWQAQVRASARAEADALQARIRPHFLFNSMNTIAGLVRRDPEVAERAVLDLSDLFRAALGAGQGDSSLRKEVELAERYLAIEALRLGPRLKVEWKREEPLPWDLPLPRLVLQPLVENAVLHGVSRLAGRDRPARRGALAAGGGGQSRAAAARTRRCSGRTPRAPQHRTPPGLRLRTRGADGRRLGRGLLSGRVPGAGAGQGFRTGLRWSQGRGPGGVP
jgi:two-component system, LytTR family, sensor histidine kinase AlgZ